ncbi:unnamed protein product [Cylindrotheca closterium]|uniref:Uncharacterized protein n=1 Tax=Cylindrotheca closterium TaxID=2856 RepID=A0AAD2G9Y2_9STRA|nr:unnamed protein product [Cylindrotheca closterium]
MIDPKSTIDALLSTMLVQQPASGHSNPLFGPPDPYLAAGKSIPPSAKALAEFGITPRKTPADFAPDGSPEYLQSIQSAMDRGWKIATIDGIKPEGSPTTLPGFSETHGILPNHNLNLLPNNPNGFYAQVDWSSKYYAVFDHLPIAIFCYCLVEFFFLRPGIDFYKEEIEADPTGATIDTVAVFGVRMVAVAIVSILTVGFFGTSQ